MLDGLIVSGLVTGSAYAILAVCLVVLFRLVGVLNLGQAAIGGFGAYTVYALAGTGLPLPLAALAGIAVSAAIAAVAGWVMARWFGEAGPVVGAVVTVVLLVVILTAGYRLFGDAPRVMPSLVPDVSFPLAGVRVSLTTLLALAATLALAAGLTLLLRRTRVGIRLQAVAERPTSAQLLGVNARALSVGVWAAAGALSALALLFVAPTRNPTFESMALLVVPALAAALVGALSNVWLAAAAGLGIGAIEGAGARVPWLADYRGALPFVVVIVALVWMRRREVWDAVR
ncbi:branched-chain amino acid ABC transporter permease [Leucobacter allii]|uniref:ABC transporter permease subunit n=1 Tax=Leucobacter allii TaxID=2932247 RepID=UPI001FCFEC94|nr:branched-chain amino acid ABC transporter permease [Leucobacter allii]UOR01994.1 branched-chain amino acid ABC transporter permease [Leucobacter allii]